MDWSDCYAYFPTKLIDGKYIWLKRIQKRWNWDLNDWCDYSSGHSGTDGGWEYRRRLTPDIGDDMTDLAQKIADAVHKKVSGRSGWWVTEHGKRAIADAIRSALPVAQGEAVAWQYRAGPGDDGWSIAFRNEVLAEVAAKNGQEVRALYAAPPASRIAELEAQVERLREALKVLAIGFSLVPHTSHEHLCRWAKECIRDIEALAAQEKNHE